MRGRSADVAVLHVIPQRVRNSRYAGADAFQLGTESSTAAPHSGHAASRCAHARQSEWQRHGESCTSDPGPPQRQKMPDVVVSLPSARFDKPRLSVLKRGGRAGGAAAAAAADDAVAAGADDAPAGARAGRPDGSSSGVVVDSGGGPRRHESVMPIAAGGGPRLSCDE